MRADKSEGGQGGGRLSIRTRAVPVAIAALLAVAAVQADPVPEGGPLTSGYGYDAAGNLTTVNLPKGVGQTTKRTQKHRPTAPKPNNSIGQLSKLTDEAGTTSYTHDGLGRVASKTQVVGTAQRAFTLGQEWGKSGTSTGKLEHQTYPGQIRVNYQYDEAGRVNGITLNPAKPDGTKPNLTQTITLLGDIGYSALNAPLKWTWGSGVAYERSYDAQGRLKTYPLGNPSGNGKAAGVRRTVNYDDAGRISGFTHTDANYDQSYAHDGLDRLKQQQQLGTSYEYDYDLNGNRKSLTINGTAYANTLDTNSNRLLTESQLGAMTNFGYNLAGDLTTAATDSAVRIASIWTMINLGRRMGCDMSAEAAAAMTLLTPSAPR